MNNKIIENEDDVIVSEQKDDFENDPNMENEIEFEQESQEENTHIGVSIFTILGHVNIILLILTIIFYAILKSSLNFISFIPLISLFLTAILFYGLGNARKRIAKLETTIYELKNYNYITRKDPKFKFITFSKGFYKWDKFQPLYLNLTGNKKFFI